MRRYFAPRKGKSAASQEAMAMFKDKNKRTMIALVYMKGIYIYMHKYVLNINLRGPSVVAVFMSLH